MRIVVRHVSEMLIAAGVRWQTATGCDRMDCMVIQVVLSANVAHAGAGLSAADPDRQPLSLLSVAQSMAFAYETVRRRASVLRDGGWLAERDGGVIVPRAALETIDGCALIAGNAASVRTAAAVLAEAGHAPSMGALDSVTTAPDAILALVALEFGVRVMQSFVDLYGSFAAGVVCAALIAANVRHLTADATLGARFATTAQVPPDEERRPISLRALARGLNLPFETVRRHVAALADRGIVERRRGGWIVPTRIITGARHAQNNQFILTQFNRMLTAAARR